MSKRSTTKSFTLELEISFSRNLLNEYYPPKKGRALRVPGTKETLDKKLNNANAVYNTAINNTKKALNILNHDIAYIDEKRCMRKK